jgi:hypothetical protein
VSALIGTKPSVQRGIGLVSAHPATINAIAMIRTVKTGLLIFIVFNCELALINPKNG